jgi:hypothetical protein
MIGARMVGTELALMIGGIIWISQLFQGFKSTDLEQSAILKVFIYCRYPQLEPRLSETEINRILEAKYCILHLEIFGYICSFLSEMVGWTQHFLPPKHLILWHPDGNNFLRLFRTATQAKTGAADWSMSHPCRPCIAALAICS